MRAICAAVLALADARVCPRLGSVLAAAAAGPMVRGLFLGFGRHALGLQLSDPRVLRPDHSRRHPRLL